jgi:hypothetical protein
MTKSFGGIVFILAFFAFGITRGIAQPVIARMPAENFDLKRDVAIMLTCKGHCYWNEYYCKKQDTSAIHQGYCTDTYNWCTSHCKTSYKGKPVVIPDILGNSPSGTQGPAGAGSPTSKTKSGGAGVR